MYLHAQGQQVRCASAHSSLSTSHATSPSPSPSSLSSPSSLPLPSPPSVFPFLPGRKAQEQIALQKSELEASRDREVLAHEQLNRAVMQVCVLSALGVWHVICSGAPLVWTPWGPGEVSCIHSIVDTLGT